MSDSALLGEHHAFDAVLEPLPAARPGRAPAQGGRPAVAHGCRQRRRLVPVEDAVRPGTRARRVADLVASLR